MEAGGDTTAPAPGDAEDLEDTRFPSEEVGEDGEVHEAPPDPGDGDLEKTGMPSSHQGLGKNTWRVPLLGEVRGGPARSLLELGKVV